MAVNINRTVKIERYWANVFGSLREAQQIAKAENPEFALQWADVRQFLQDCFVQTAQDAVIVRWENIIGLVPSSTDTLDERRARILYMMSVTLPYTFRMLKHVYLANIVGEGNYEAHLDIMNSELEVRINPAKTSQWEDVQMMLDTICPVNIQITLSNMGTPHSTMSRYTHNQLSAYTHEQITNELQFQ